MYSYATLNRFIAKTNYWGEDTAYCPYHTISNSRPVVCQSVSQIKGSLPSTDQSTCQSWP